MKRRRAPPRNRRYTKRRRFNKGYDRRSGMYGRYYPNNPRSRQPEKKFFDTAVNSTFTTAGTVIPSFNLLTEGTGVNELVGRKIFVTSVQFDGLASVPAGSSGSLSSVSNTTGMRLIFYIDKQCNGAAATAAQLLATPSTIFSYLNLENSKRFRIVKDFRFSWPIRAITWNDTPATYSCCALNRRLKFYKEVSFPIEFADNAGGNITDIRSCNIGALLLTTTVTPGTPALLGSVRIRYRDA